MVSMISPLESIVLIFSFSKKTGMFLSLSCRIYFRQSKVLRANLLMDLVIIISIMPFMQSSIMRLNSSRFFVLVPVITYSFFPFLGFRWYEMYSWFFRHVSPPSIDPLIPDVFIGLFILRSTDIFHCHRIYSYNCNSIIYVLFILLFI